MNAKQQAAADIKFLSVRMKGILGLADDLDRVGSLEQAENELNARSDKIKKDIKMQEDKLTKAKTAADEAEKEAEKIVAEAKVKAEANLNSADENAKKTTADAAAEISRLQGLAARELEDTKRELAGAKSELAQVKRDTTAAEANYNSILTSLEILKKKIA